MKFSIMSKMVPIKIIDLANLQVYVFLMVKPANIKSANISDSYKKAFLAAYKEAKNEDEGYFFEPAKAIIGYLLGISSEAPNSQLNAIDLASLVDADTLWDEIDERVVSMLHTVTSR